MNKGKQKCEALRRLRKKAAEHYGLHYNPPECHHRGDCIGTCPQCEAELDDLQRQIDNIDTGNPEADEREKNERRRIIEDLFDNGDDEVVPPLQGKVVEIPADNWDGPLQGDIESPLPGIPPAPPEPKPKSKRRKLIGSFYIAGIMFHDVEDIWDELYIGAPLALVPEPQNKYDHNAVAVALADDYDPEYPEDFDFDCILGYVPRTENARLSAILNMGWEEIFSAEIAELDRHAAMEKRIGVDVYIESKGKVNPEEDYKLYAISLDEDGAAEMLEELHRRGTVHFRWCCGLPDCWADNPNVGQNVLVLTKGDKKSQNVYLMKVLAIGRNSRPYLDDPSELDWDDDSTSYVLTNLQGPLKAKSKLTKLLPADLDLSPTAIPYPDAQAIYRLLPLPVFP